MFFITILIKIMHILKDDFIFFQNEISTIIYLQDIIINLWDYKKVAIT